MDRSGPRVGVVVLSDETSQAGETPDILRDRVLGLAFEDDEAKADRALLTLRNNDLALFELGEDVLGGTILELTWGYGGGQLAPPRRMVIKSIKANANTLTVEAHALSVQMARETKTRVWHGVRRSDVVRQIAAENGYEGAYLVVDDGAEVQDAVNQMGETDAHLLRRLAVAEGFEFFVDDTGLHWHRRRVDLAPVAVLHWYGDQGGGDVLDWSIESDLMRRVGRVRVVGRDGIAKKDVDESATNDTTERTTLGDVIEVVDPETGETTLQKRNATQVTRAIASVGDAATKAAKQAKEGYRRAERSAVMLAMTVVGNPALRAKAVVEVRGLTAMFDGLYYIRAAKHSIGTSGYTTELRMERDAKGKLAARAAAQAKATRAQGGDKNRAEAKKPGEITRIERVDPETGATRIEYHRDGRPVSTPDPEGT